MAEKDFTDTVHQTQPDRFYDDTNAGSALTIEEKPPQPEANPYYTITETSVPPPPMQSMNKLPNLTHFKPTPYDGKTDPRLWLNHYEALSRALFMTDEQRYSVVSLYLRHPASTYFQNNEHIFGGSWNKFKELFVERFIHSMHHFILTESIMREKLIDDDLDSFWEDKIMLMKMTSPNMTEIDKMNHMITGLTEDLRIEVLSTIMNRPCDTVEQLRKLVKEVHELQKYRKNFRKNDQNYFRRTYTNALFERKPRTREDHYSESGEIKRLEQSIRDIKKNLRTGDPEPTPEITSTKVNMDPKTVDTRFNPRTRSSGCFNCGQEGHWKNECKAPPKPWKRNTNQRPGNGPKRD